MAYLSIEEIKGYLHEENVDAITRNDDTVVQAAIDSGISEAKGYLKAYDVDAIFNATGAARNALLLTFVKDLSAWHIMKLSNAGVHYEYRKQVYERAIQWLKDVQKGNIMPDLPALANDEGEPLTNGIKFGSNDKKSNRF